MPRWTPPQRIRPIVIALVRREGRLLVMEGRDEDRRRTFYRPLGGGIEFGERGEDALRRELREEVGVTLGELTYVGAFENLYELHGQRGHEIVLVYEAHLVEQLGERDIVEDGIVIGRALWIPIADFRSHAAWLVPQALLELL